MEEGDVNSPSAESIIRQILYGNNWFRKEFGMASEEYMLPDCFGFPASLPSILAHAGIKYRYLLFDTVATETDDDWGNTFYSEIDVIEHAPK